MRKTRATERRNGFCNTSVQINSVSQKIESGFSTKPNTKDIEEDMGPERFIHRCDYVSLTSINTLIKEDRFIRVRNMICEKTPFGELLKMDDKPGLKKYVALNAVNTWNGKKLVIGNKEYEIDSELVNKSLNLSITGDRTIKPREEDEVPIFIKQEMPQLRRDNKEFHSLVIAKFRARDNAEVVDILEVKKLSKLYIALLFSALLFPKRQRIPLEYFYLLDDEYHFENLKLYRFDIEIAKFLGEGIITAKYSKAKSVTVSGCLQIIESLYPEEKLPMVHVQNKREREESEVEHIPAFKRTTRSSVRNCSGAYPLKKEPPSGNSKIQIIEIEDDSSEDDVNDVDYDGEDEEVTHSEVHRDQTPKSCMPVKRETTDNATSTVEYMGPGQPFIGHHSCDIVVLDDGKCEYVGGFSIPKNQAQLYKQIWLRYGHIASSKVLTDSYAQVPVVSGIMTTITSMQYCRFSDLTSEIIAVWEETIKKAEKVEFNIKWVRDWLEDFKKDFFEMKKLESESIAAKNALKEAEEKVAALNMEMQKYVEKDSQLLSRGWLQ